MSVFEKSVGNGLQHCETFEVFLSYGGFELDLDRKKLKHILARIWSGAKYEFCFFPYEGIAHR